MWVLLQGTQYGSIKGVPVAVRCDTLSLFLQTVCQPGLRTR